MKTFLLSLVFLLFLDFSCFALGSTCEIPNCVEGCDEGAFNPNARVAFSKNNKQKYNPDVLNLTPKSKQLYLPGDEDQFLKTATTPISIEKAEFEQIAAVRKSWLLFYDPLRTFSMDIGTVDYANPQIWNLPGNLLNYSTYAHEDFVPMAEVPEELQFPEANIIAKSYYRDAEQNLIEVYNHFYLDDTEIINIGVSYYYYLEGDENSFDADNYKFTDVPMSLGDSYSFTEMYKNPVTNKYLDSLVHTKTVDAFGVINTPTGQYECLRFTISTDKYSRVDEVSPFTFSATTNLVGFVTEEGFMFTANKSAASGTATMSNIQIRYTVPTALFDEGNDIIQINNDGTGVSINNYGAGAHSSAVLDVESDSLGILIPRILEANRPANATEGLLIYQTDNSPGFYYYDGAAWQRLDNTGGGASARVAVKPSQNINIKKNAGISKLTKGKSFISFPDGKTLDPEQYIVNLQAEGENNGLYISKKTESGFEVKEQGRSNSNIKFSWTIIEL
ncbi:hypothetical protein [Lacihabitans sp. LS3-19]|uniref:hypothetical protein n=1 Tax=Lacihabitans sp. LS3-19 TaxID=2487335 RepID=UPI0020CB6E49|nr:hypothetical protein [Lacihabitans sp. LS3-19]